MRQWIDLFESASLPADQVKFWYSSAENRFVFHEVDFHHTKAVATYPESFGLTRDDVAHHPHASGQYASDNEDDYGDPEFDDAPEDSNDLYTEDQADNDDMGMFAQLFQRGWVRGGHYIDIMSYHEYGQVRADDGVYLQGTDIRALRKCVRACLKQWPQLQFFNIEPVNPTKDIPSFIKLEDWQAIDRFVKTGRL